MFLQTRFTNSLIAKDPECQCSTCLRRFKLLFIPILPWVMWLRKLVTVFCYFALLGINNISDEIICISRDIETSGEDERNTSMSGNDSFFFLFPFDPLPLMSWRSAAGQFSHNYLQSQLFDFININI